MEYVDRGNVERVKKHETRSRKSIIAIENGLKIDIKQDNGFFTKFKQYPYHDWDSLNYQNFMMAILESLEVRYFEPRQIICREMEKALEFYFV